MKPSVHIALSFTGVLLLTGCGGGGSGSFSQCTEVSFKGITYCAVMSPYTGRTWLDRNLGASEVCTSLDDANCYGDYYQWGRLADGHEIPDSNKTDVLAEDIANAGSAFIMSQSLPYDWVNTANNVDDDGSLRTAQWHLTDGTSVCPAGYRVPTNTELEDELLSAQNTITNNVDAYESFLKLPSAGYRDNSDGTLHDMGKAGYVWSNTVSRDLNMSTRTEYNATDATNGPAYRALGQSVRCIQNY